MATTPRISALIEALRHELEIHGDLPMLGWVNTADFQEFVEIDLELNLDGEEPVMLLVLDCPSPTAAEATTLTERANQ